jgi:hypothetical protein
VTNILLGGDFHCGAQQGITPPGYEEGAKTKWSDTQKLLWDNYQEIVNTLPPVDYFFLLGDLLHGQESRQDGYGLVTGDLHRQAEMAVKAIKIVRARKYAMVYGTEYHVTVGGVDMEDVIADKLGISQEARGDHIFPKVAGYQFDLKHRVGCSSIPESRVRLLAKEMEYAKQWFLEGVQPMPDILVRAHCHYYAEAHGTTGHGDWMAIGIPGLQGLGSRYGARVCTGVINFGLVLLTINEGEPVQCRKVLRRPQVAKVRSL